MNRRAMWTSLASCLLLSPVVGAQPGPAPGAAPAAAPAPAPGAAPAAAAPRAAQAAAPRAAPAAGAAPAAAPAAAAAAAAAAPAAAAVPAPGARRSFEVRLGEVEVKLEAWLEELAGVLARKDLPDPDRENALRVQADVARALVAARDVEKSRKPDRRARALKELREALEALRVHVTVRVAARATAWVEMVDKAGPLLSVAEIDALLEYAEPEQVKAREAAAAAATPAASAKRVTLENGGHLEYGFTVSLLRFSTSRRDDEPARLRNYTPALEVIPPEFGFQFTYHPNTDPWRLKTSDRSGYQLMSAGGILLARVDGSNLERGGIALAATLGFFEDSIGLGAGFDLYRGIPVAGPDGAEAGATAHTGVLAWALARNGEVTPENVFVVLTLNLAGLAGRVAGEGK